MILIKDTYILLSQSKKLMHLDHACINVTSMSYQSISVSHYFLGYTNSLFSHAWEHLQPRLQEPFLAPALKMRPKRTPIGSFCARFDENYGRRTQGKPRESGGS